ncbi:hypothetical protein Vadar_019495 [Vaccinium darrowii]|uniref:Uncharacterized protein n=1 Tax=Vaccinium darrowii TaxID=229202 RepID=A0ACB7Y940_9ERIC|nr:hypothetical protein Vadar_019495 [Vaccinium darrowii]
MKGEDGFFHPHNLDFRGRAYPMHPHLNHLGSELCRGILEFSEGRPLGKTGLRWLKIHLANLRNIICTKVYNTKFDKVELEKIVENVSELPDTKLDAVVREVFDVAYNIYAFHAAQKLAETSVESTKGGDFECLCHSRRVVIQLCGVCGVLMQKHESVMSGFLLAYKCDCVRVLNCGVPAINNGSERTLPCLAAINIGKGALSLPWFQFMQLFGGILAQVLSAAA